MTKVYPNAGAAGGRCPSDEKLRLMKSDAAVQLTVWKKSLLFNCDGFTVFDAKGNLVYRVDNYLEATSGVEIVLMDASGTSLLTIRRKRLSLGDNWMVYKGETEGKPIFTARKHMNLLNSKSLAHVSSSCSSPSSGSSSSSLKQDNKIIYKIEGSYAQRCCAVYDQKRRRVAEIRRKEAAVGGISLGLDVFSLVVLRPHEMDSSVAMALVILLDQMF